MSESRFWISTGEDGWREVPKAHYVSLERLAGFHNTMGQPDEPATAGFGNGDLRGSTIDPTLWGEPPAEDESLQGDAGWTINAGS